MTETMEKPVFEIEKRVHVHDSDGSKLVFNTELVGPYNYFQLREAKYGRKELGLKSRHSGKLFL